MEFCLFHSNPCFAHNFQVDLALLLQYCDFFTKIMMILNPGQIQWLGDGACGGEGILLEVDNWGSSSWPDAGPAYRYLVVNRKKRLQVPEEKIRNRLFYYWEGEGAIWNFSENSSVLAETGEPIETIEPCENSGYSEPSELQWSYWSQ